MKRLLTRSLAALLIAIYFGEEDFTGGALYFHSYKNPSDWDFHNAYTLSKV